MIAVRAILRVSVGLVAAAVPSSLAAQAVSPEALELGVMSFNLRYGTADDGDNSWPFRRQLVFDVVREYGAAVLGTQEVLRFQLDELRAEFPDYAEIGVGRDDGRTAGEYAAILYRPSRFELADQGTFWFSDTPEVPGSVSWGNRITRICTWARLVERTSRRAFYVYNVHLDHESQESRERSVELLAARIRDRAHPDPVIVTGDFNAGEDNPAMQYLKGQRDRAFTASSETATSPRLRDTFRVLQPDAHEVGTFNEFRGTATGDKIDAVLASAEWQVLSAEIVRRHRRGRYPSDHFPVVTRIRIGSYHRPHLSSFALPPRRREEPG